MLILEALKKNGKAVDVDIEPSIWYVRELDGILFWFGKKDNVKKGAVRLIDILKRKWQPYPEVKEIRPEKAGELWDHGGIKYFTVESQDQTLCLRPCREGLCSLIIDNVIHGKYNCKRLFPPVEDKKVCAFDHACLDKDVDILKLAEEVGPLPEDKNVERIEIEDVYFQTSSSGLFYPTTATGRSYFNEYYGNFVGKPIKKMTLEFAKETS